MIELGENRVHCKFEDGKIGLLLDMRESICLLMHAGFLGCEYITKVEEIDLLLIRLEVQLIESRLVGGEGLTRWPASIEHGELCVWSL